MGTLFAWYPSATVFYLGGTFNKVGGHNALEPAAFGLPVITGPFIASDNTEALEMEKGGGLRRVADAEKLTSLTLQILRDSPYRQEWSQKNKEWLNRKALLVSRQLDGVATALKE